jgi:CRISPR-associated protein Cas2
MSPSSFPEAPGPRRRLVVVAYDVVDDRRRDRAANVLLDCGVRVQYSVFECVLARAELRELVRRLHALIDAAEDGVAFYPVCRRCRSRVRTLGRPPPDPDPQYRIL